MRPRVRLEVQRSWRVGGCFPDKFYLYRDSVVIWDTANSLLEYNYSKTYYSIPVHSKSQCNTKYSPVLEYFNSSIGTFSETDIPTTGSRQACPYYASTIYLLLCISSALLPVDEVATQIKSGCHA